MNNSLALRAMFVVGFRMCVTWGVRPLAGSKLRVGGGGDVLSAVCGYVWNDSMYSDS